jgi:hypothetical protein
MYAGASNFEQDADEWEKIFSTVVGGEIKNIYLKDDEILKIYQSTCDVK